MPAIAPSTCKIRIVCTYIVYVGLISGDNRYASPSVCMIEVSFKYTVFTILFLCVAALITILRVAGGWLPACQVFHSADTLTGCNYIDLVWIIKSLAGRGLC